MSSQIADPMWTKPGLKNGIDVRELNSTFFSLFFFFGGGGQAGNEFSSHPPKSLRARKKPLNRVQVNKGSVDYILRHEL